MALKLRDIVSGAVVMALSISPAYAIDVTPIPAHAAPASIEDRKDISISISSDLRWEYTGQSNPFGTNRVELGATVIGGPWRQYALADWRSEDLKSHGQAFLITKGCSVWTIEKVSVGRSLAAKDLIGPDLSPQAATDLVVKLKALESEHIAYLRPLTGPTC